MSAEASEFTRMVASIRPLNFKTLKKLQPLLAKMNMLSIEAVGVPSIEVMDTMVALVHIALSSQTENVTIDFVEEHLTMENGVSTIESIFSVAGVKPQGEA